MQNRNEKKIYPLSIIRFVMPAILILLAICPSFIIIGFFVGEYPIYMLIFGIVVMAVFTLEFFWEIKKCIIFDEIGIRVFSDKTIIFRKIQYGVKVSYEEINCIQLIISNKNSKNQPMFGCFVKMPYLLINCKNGKSQMINFYYYSKIQSAQIIDEIKKQTKLRGNNLEIPLGNDMILEFAKINKQSKK